jgi:murein DD-endopeptidase MepM/ murein hydrolase activator NlpD
VAFTIANQQLPGAQQKVQESKGQVAAAQVQATEAARVADKARAELAVAQTALDATEQQVTDARGGLDEYIRSSYEGSSFLGPNALIGARSPDEVLDSIGYLDSLAGNQKRAVDAVSRARFAASMRRAEVLKKKQAADRAEARAQAALGQAQNAQSRAQAAAVQVAQLINQRKHSLQIAQQEKAANARQYASLQAESRRIADALQAIAGKGRHGRHGGKPSVRPHGDGQLSMPVNGWKSSDFGWRYDPYYRVWQLHAGTDFAAPAGTPIWAAASGVVARAGWNGGYGNYTCIYHYELPSGRSLSTCYGHQSHIGVYVGEHVTRGQVIGRVGTTGASTGNHLHFEVRLDGEPVNPLPWL